MAYSDQVGSTLTPARTKTRHDTLEFKSTKEMETWLAANHSNSDGIWLRIYKKGSGVPSIKVGEALEVALCYGWITGQSRPHDEESWLGRFVPRRPKSIWSKINVGIAERLVAEGRMKPAGLKQVEAAKKDGRWSRAYSSPKDAVFPPDFLDALGKNEKALAFSKTLNRANFYAIVFRIENAKTPKRRIAKITSIVEMLENEETFH